MGTEIWKAINGFDGYEISNYGRIRNTKGEIMQTSGNGLGYAIFRRTINGTYKKEYVHRLVAFAFIPNPENKPCINHLDCNTKNNRADNLEWCTKAENTAYMIKLGRNKRTEIWIQRLNTGLEPMRKRVVGVAVKTGETIEFDGVNKTREAGFQPSCVSNCCKGIRKQHKGYIWRYA